MGATINALAELADVDVVCMLEAAGVARAPEQPDAPAHRLLVVTRPRPGGRATAVVGASHLALPSRLARDYTHVRAEVRGWGADRYDLVWLGRAEGYVAFGGLYDAPTVVDLDDLEDRKLRGRPVLASGGPRRMVRERIDRARWSRLQREVAGGVDTVLVCSDPDARHLGVPNAECLPNPYPEPIVPAGSVSVSERPTVTFVALMTYAPNADAARFLVSKVAPHLRRLVPGARVRIVGRHDDRVARLARPGVDVVGFVPDLERELRLADVIAVPVRFGGGTRVKVIEGFAHGIPVVSTTAGVEGIPAEHGRHLLVADSPRAFAAACAQALTDAELRRRLRDASTALWRERYRPASLARNVTRIVTAASARHGSSLDVSGDPRPRDRSVVGSGR